MGTIEYYLIGINIICFLLYMINKAMDSRAGKSLLNIFLMIGSIVGGSAGNLLAILLFDRKAEKRNMMLRIFTLCIFVIQIVLLLLLKGNHTDPWTFAFWEFFARHKILSVYLVIVNVLAFAVYGIDKMQAVRQKARIRIVTLPGLALIGGSVGSLIAMYFFRHKTKKSYFTIGVPLIIVMQAVLVFYVMNAGW